MVFQYDMDLYTLTPQFLIRHKIERYTSLIWTERYSAAGDFQMVCPPTNQLTSVLYPGRLLGLRGRREVMIIDTLSFENGMFTISGFSLVKFLNQRIGWFENPHYAPPDDTTLYADYTTDGLTAGEFISDVVDKLVINPVPFSGPYSGITLDWASEKFPQLSLGHIDYLGSRKKLTFTNGNPVYDEIESIASTEGVGISLYLASANFDTGEYVLRFATYCGRDHTSDQDVFNLVRFTPKTETLTNPTEVRGNADYKNVLYVRHKDKITVHYPEFIGSPPLGFDRRVLYVEAPDTHYTGDELDRFLAGFAHKVFMGHIHTHTIDGQALGHETQYHFPRDYYLGDIVEVEGHSGLIVKAQVTEYIRSQDQYGMKEYPTLTILAEDQTHYHSDTTFDIPPMVGGRFSLVPGSSGDNPADPLGDPLYPGVNTVFGDTDTSQDPLLNNTNVNEGPVELSTEQDLHVFGDMKVPEWYYDTDVGYYIHSGTVYIVGSVNAGFKYILYPGSDVILKDIPAEIAPEFPCTGRVLIDHNNSTIEYAYDSGLEIGPWLDVTIHPDGTITLDNGNPFRPADNDDDYTWLTLILSGISWPTGNTIYDAYSTTVFGDTFISTQARVLSELSNTIDADAWENIDAAFSAHGGRLHLNGKAKVKTHWGDVYDPFIGVPREYQPKRSAEVFPPVDEFGWCEVPQKDGYRCLMNYWTAGSGRVALLNEGAQNPQAAGNKGCGHFVNEFYQRYSAGFIARGSTPSLVAPHFMPALADVDVDYIGCSGNPVIEPLPDVANWTGNSYHARIRFTIDDLLSTMGPIIFTLDEDLGYWVIDYDAIQGPNQFAFIMGLTPEMTSPQTYFKTVFTYDTSTDDLWVHILKEQCGSGTRGLLATLTRNLSTFGTGTTTSTPLEMSFGVLLSPNPDGYTHWLLGGFGPGSGIGSGADHVFSGPAMGLPTISPKGHMGFHIPPGTDIQVLDARVAGDGDFPKMAPDDVLDFTGCGWPLT
jgi:hypothetical protein